MRYRMLIVACFIMTSCAQGYDLVQPHERVEIGDYSVDPQIAWSARTEDGVQFWTVDGPLLNAVRLVNGLEPGETLFKAVDEEAPPVVFRRGLAPAEVMEFIIDSMLAAGWSRVEPLELAPIRFGSHPGYRFTYEAWSATGLPQRGVAAGTIRDDRLYLVIFTAAQDYYYDRYAPKVERMIESIVM